jgi:hypothetical protein
MLGVCFWKTVDLSLPSWRCTFASSSRSTCIKSRMKRVFSRTAHVHSQWHRFAYHTPLTAQVPWT